MIKSLPAFSFIFSNLGYWQVWTMLHSFFLIVHPVQDYLAPVCLVVAWTILFILIASFWTLTSDTVTHAKRMHQIPCAGCQFFTGDYHLKCAVHPAIALSEAAIGCPDYRTASLTLHSEAACDQLPERQAVARTAVPSRRASLATSSQQTKPVSRV
ncbi:MAG: hypothetical protein KME35_09325 [Aphanocapsa sp. GSE-SYN-MK-11-07L]|jgi:hypothetical protein|nr:hypothetical protein [Aphanocapsa sp. GSE-SYN-MK-11-07L]